MLVNKSHEVWRKCRLCLRNDVFLIFLFEKSGALTNLGKAIKELLQYEVSRDDKYPPFVCCKCSDKVWEFKEFKEKCDSTKNTFEAILSSGSIYADVHNSTLLGKHKPIIAKEEPSDFLTEKRLKKCISFTKPECVKEEEELPECTYATESYEVFMESIRAEIPEEGSKMDSGSGMQVSELGNATDEKGQEPIGINMSYTQKSDSCVHSLGLHSSSASKEQESIVMEKSYVQHEVKDSDSCKQVMEHETASANQEAEEESEFRLVLSDSDCEIMEHDATSASKEQEAKQKPCAPLKVSDSHCNVQMAEPFTESGATGPEIIGKKSPLSQQNVADSESEEQILEHDKAANAKGRESIGREESPIQLSETDSDSDLEILLEKNILKRKGQESIFKDQHHSQDSVTEAKKNLKQRRMTNYFEKHVTSPRKCGRGEECSVGSSAQSSPPSANKEHSNDIFKESNSQDKNSSDKEIRLPGPEVDDSEEIGHLSNNNGRLQWSFRTVGKPDGTGNVALHLKESGEICVNETRSPEGDCVSKSTNSGPGMGSKETSEECQAIGERENQSDDKSSESKQSHNPITYISEYKAINEHECNRCGKQFQNCEKLKRHVSMDRTIHCQYCTMSFKNDSELFEHLSSHDGNVRWSCGDCGEKSVRWKDVWVHIQIHRKAHTCKEMAKPNSIQGNICKVCHKRLPNKSSLRMHLLSHSEEKSWVCPHCQENFSEQGSLVRHIERHNSTKYSIK